MTPSSSTLPRVSAARPIPVSEHAAAGVVKETEEEKVRRLQPRPSPKARKASMRKGNLSMFLHGELERSAPREPPKAAEPARTWGAVAPSRAAAPSLACIQNEQVRSGTSPAAAGQWAMVGGGGGGVGAAGGTSRVPGSSPSAAVNVTMPQRRDSGGGGIVGSWGAVGAAGAAAAVHNEASSAPEGSFTVSLAHLVRRQKRKEEEQKEQTPAWGAAAATPCRVPDGLMSIQQEQSRQRAQASLSKSVGALDGGARGGHPSGVTDPTAENRWYRPTPVAATSLHDIQMEEARAMRELLERKAQEERVAAEALLAKAKAKPKKKAAPAQKAAATAAQKAAPTVTAPRKKSARGKTAPAQKAVATPAQKAAATPAQKAAATPAQKAAPTATPPRKKSARGKTARDSKRDDRPVLATTTSKL